MGGEHALGRRPLVVLGLPLGPGGRGRRALALQPEQCVGLLVGAHCRVERGRGAFGERHRLRQPGGRCGRGLGDGRGQGVDRQTAPLFDLRGEIDQRLLGAHHRGVDRPVVLGDLRAHRAPAIGEPGLEVGEPRDVEQPLQERGAVVGLGAQERSELALRQQHHLRELVEAEPDEVVENLGGLVGSGAQRRPPSGEALLEQHFRLAGSLPVSALLGDKVFGGAGDAQPALGDGELEPHFGGGARLRVVAHQSLGLAASGSRHRGEQREADGVEHGGLAAAGGAVHQKQPVGAERVEVDRLGATERTEGPDLQVVQPHATPSRASPPMAAIPSSSAPARSI